MKEETDALCLLKKQYGDVCKALNVSQPKSNYNELKLYMFDILTNNSLITENLFKIDNEKEELSYIQTTYKFDREYNISDMDSVTDSIMHDQVNLFKVINDIFIKYGIYLIDIDAEHHDKIGKINVCLKIKYTLTES